MWNEGERRNRDENVRGRRGEIPISVGMNDCGNKKTSQKKDRIIFSQHRNRRQCACRGGPGQSSPEVAVDECISGQGPDQKQSLVCPKTLRMKLIEGSQ